MMRNRLQWFQEVAKFVQSAQRVAKNKKGETPEMVFRKAHQKLIKEGVKWTKHTTTSSKVFATLIATVAFAGGMHAPGGDNNTNNGGPLPVLLQKQALITFVIADAISLPLSVTSIIIFLSIITSRYSEVDFLSKCPQRLYIGLVILLISINTMVIAFVVALYLLVGPTHSKHQIPQAVWVTPVIVLFLLAFTPLILPIHWYLHGQKLFGRKSSRTLH